jgi:predicted small lipoprotein YifL
VAARRALALLVLVLGLAGCGGGGPQTLMDRLESALDASVDDVLDDEGYGAARNVQCGEFDSSLGTCTVDFPVGQDVFRDRYSVTLVGKRCWRARQIELERLTGRDSDALALPRHLEGCFDE